jgi:hypothetical protein
MKCAKCGKQTEVVKVYQFPTEARRRRECLTCGFRFTTAERVWRKVYAEEIRAVKERPPRKVRPEPAPRRKSWSNFDVVSVDDYQMEWEDVSTYVHVRDD